MRVAILGTRGIPNNYGGFEQLAQHLSIGLIKKGHDVYVYNSHKHPFQEKEWNSVKIIHCFDPENYIGSFGQFIYDLNCIKNARRQNFDIVINLGYTSSSIWMWLFKSHQRVITNMDGLEWKRSKYKKPVQAFLRYAEKIAVKRSAHLIADSKGIKTYLENKYGVKPTFIAYGAPVFANPDQRAIAQFDVKERDYDLLIARMEPENNIEMILDGCVLSNSRRKFYIVGNVQNRFGQYLVDKYKSHSRFIFTGPIYNAAIIDNLRHFCNLYFHGHSVGGTNPSLLEAMGCESLIAAHNNEFNKSVLDDDAFYFKNAEEVRTILENNDAFRKHRATWTFNNLNKIALNYTWEKIVEEYNAVFAND
jgi:glycosyltransferase involved in cell wall biosynthesis